MYDATDPSRIPPDARMVAGYVGGRWPTYADGSLAAAFPAAQRVSVAVSSAFDAQILDVENGDATPQTALAWVRRRRASGLIPTCYANLSTWPQIRAVFAAAGEPLPYWWAAQPDGIAALGPGQIAKQYAWTPGYDLSVVAAYWPGVDPPPAPPPSRKAHRMYLVRDQTTGAVYLQDSTGALHYIPDVPDVSAYLAAGLPFVQLTHELVATFPGAKA